jgi:mono/diheme cytochrome c family protein
VNAFRHAAVLALLLLLCGCDNMDHQPNVRPMEPSAHFPNGSSAQPPPAHTVARGAPLPGDSRVNALRDGELVTQLPVPLTRELLDRGRERFNIFCATCHGEDGYGRGIVVRRGFPAPPSYHEERLRAAPIGHFYDVITRGYGVMYSYADRVAPNDRWAIAAYIRALQRSQHAVLADVPAAERNRLDPR